MPSRNISITATSIRTTDRIDNSETYNKNATVLPSHSSKQNAKIEECMQPDRLEAAHQPNH
jgi:hypothetical protein